jgi:ATP-dependent protease ClpP protease subunit
MNQPQPLSLSQSNPGGCFIGFNAAVDRKAAEQLVLMCGEAVKNGFTEIHLLLSSIGGDLIHTYYLCSVLDALPIKFITYNIGSVMSAANLLYLCGDERYAIPGSTFYFHQTHFPAPTGNVSEPFVRAHARSIVREDQRSATFVAAKIGSTPQDVRKWQRSELFMDTSTALARGIIHGIKAPVIPPNALFHQIVV